MEIVLKNEREASQAIGRQYAIRPASIKGSMALKSDSFKRNKF